MDCDEVRAAISASIDGEADGAEDAAVADHTAGCAGCRQWRRTAERIDRLARIAPVSVIDGDDDPVRSDRTWRRERPHRFDAPRRITVVRAALLITALAQIAIGAAGLIDDLGMALHGGHGSAHMSHELVAFNIAIGVALLTVAHRVDRANAQVPMLVAFVALLAGVSAMDLLSGQVGWARLVTHLPVLIGLVLAVIAARTVPGRTGPVDSAAIAPAGHLLGQDDRPAKPSRPRWPGTPPEPAARTGSAA